MDLLVVFGAEGDGAGEVAERVAATVRRSGHRADVATARHCLDVESYDAVVIGAEVRDGRWHHDARQFALRHTMALRDRRVWCYSCAAPAPGVRAAATDAEPTPEARELMEFVGARGHATLAAPLRAPGFAALRADWSARRRITRWARDLGRDLDGARPPHGLGPARLWAALLGVLRRPAAGLPGTSAGR
jgi:menaquinone-dependent protoporphyrinogen oxidase